MYYKSYIIFFQIGLEQHINELKKHIDAKGFYSKQSVPCMTKQRNRNENIQTCCDVFSHMFDRKYVDRIMRLMKYSLDISNPETFQDFNIENEFGDIHLSDKGWR